MEIQPIATPFSHPILTTGHWIPRLVAHRGYTSRFPENTLLALNEALRSGACFVEFDVQCSADGIPVIFHDRSLKRTTGVEGQIFDLPLSELRGLQAHEPERLGRRFANAGVGIPTLRDALYLIKNYPKAQAFVEIKDDSLEKFGIEKVAKTLLKDIAIAPNQSIVISYNSLAIRCCRAMGAKRIGWVVDNWNAEARTLATGLAPDYIFCNVNKIPNTVTELWPGPWQWVIYDINDPEFAVYLAALGAHLVETSAVGELMSHPLLRQGGCFEHCVV